MEHGPPVGAGLPAKAVGQSMKMLNDRPPSLASQLQQGDLVRQVNMCERHKHKPRHMAGVCDVPLQP
ncbi:hypothetical protein ELQ88_23795 [Pseudomonas sp. MPC6]|nr:hypothetical protein ELQ88_23795 [Pseudomonas sp. MPC6]